VRGRVLDTARVALFVPGDRPERISRAVACGADCVVIDLEDSVAPAGKGAARTAALQAIGQLASPAVGLRVNALTSAAGIADLAALLFGAAWPAFVVLPKVEAAEQVRLCAAVLGERGWRGELLCCIESAGGLERAADIAAADPAVAALGFGGVDLAADLGAELAWEPMLAARSRVVWAAAKAGIRALDVPCLDLAATSSLADECQRVRALGFDGKLAIHPKQVRIIRDAFSPSRDEIATARAVLATAGGGGAVRHGSSMVDAAVVRRAQRTLDSAELAELKDKERDGAR
jgi:(S)-citramalyl-CoA lyase